MSILNNRQAVKNATSEEKTDFIFNNLINDITEQATYEGSIPNKLVSAALSAVAAYSVGVNPCYIAVTVVVTVFFCLLTTPRWLMEMCLISNLVIISVCTLPETSVTTLEYLLLLKLAFELFCVGFDKLTQLYAAITADQKHSYYFMWTIVTWGIAFAVTNSLPFINGFVDGFHAGISGM